MKILSALFLVLLPAVRGEHLRRELQEGTAPRVERRLNAAAIATINAAIVASLPTLNGLIQAQIDDPVPINQATTQAATLTTGTCAGNAATATGSIIQMEGTKTTAINSMEVVEGTESLECGCPTAFKGDFAFDIGASQYTGRGSSVFAESAGTCGTLTTAWTGVVASPKFTGLIYIEGTIDGNAVSISMSEVKSIEGTCDSIAVTPDTTIDSTNDFFDISELMFGTTGTLNGEFKTWISTTLTDLLKLAIQTGIDASRTELGFGGGAPFIVEFYRSEAEERIEALRTNTTDRIANWESQASDIADNWNNQAQGAIDAWYARGEQVASSVGFASSNETIGFNVGGPSYTEQVKASAESLNDKAQDTISSWATRLTNFVSNLGRGNDGGRL